MSLLSVESLLKRLRTPSDGKFLFDDYLSDAWEIFQFDGEPDLASFEGFLIETVFQIFDEAEQNRENAKKRDACLVGLGLLEKCYHTKTNSSVPAHCDISTRCVSYLSGDYIKLSYPVPEEGANYNITDPKSLPRQALDQSARRARKQLSNRLTYMAACSKESCQKCLQAGIENHTKQITISDGENERIIKKVILPQPCYTLENFPISEQQPAPEIQQDTHLDGAGDSDACGKRTDFSGQNTDSDENISDSTIESELPNTSSSSSCNTSNGSSGTSESETKSHTDASGDVPPHPPKAGAEMSAFRTDEKDKPERSFKSNKWAIIAGVLAILLLTMMPLFAIYTLNQSKKTNIDQVKASEGGGIVNPDEASIEPNMSMTYQNPNGVKVDINISGISEPASVSIESDMEAGKIIISLNEYYYKESQDAAIKDFPVGGDTHEDGN